MFKPLKNPNCNLISSAGDESDGGGGGEGKQQQQRHHHADCWYKLFIKRSFILLNRNKKINFNFEFSVCEMQSFLLGNEQFLSISTKASSDSEWNKKSGNISETMKIKHKWKISLKNIVSWQVLTENGRECRDEKWFSSRKHNGETERKDYNQEMTWQLTRTFTLLSDKPIIISFIAF